MSRLYTVVLSGTVTAAGTDTDLFLLLPAANKPIRLRELHLAQYSEVGDTAEEAVRITIRRLAATITNGTGGAAATPVALDENDTAAGFTARANDTGVATTSGSNTIAWETAWNERNSPASFIWLPETAIRAQNAGGIVVRLETTLADDISGAFSVIVEEF